MKEADWKTLQEKIVLPDLDKHLIPLMLYRGSQSLGRISRMWNFAITCMESEVESFSEAVRLSQNPDFAHLLGPHKSIVITSLNGFFGRLEGNPFVTNNIQGLTSYVRKIKGFKACLTPISIYTNNPYHAERLSPWRILGYSPERLKALSDERQQKVKKREQKTTERRRLKLANKRPQEHLFYPYMAYRPGGTEQVNLVSVVNEAVPKGLPDWIRADICQDLIVAILSNEMAVSDLQNEARDYMGSVLKTHPLKYGPLSIDTLMSAGMA